MDFIFFILVLMILFSLAYKISSVAKYLIKWGLFGLFSVLMTCATIPFMLLRPRDSRNALFPAYGGIIASRAILGISTSLEGQENIVKNSGCVILINHQSYLDLLVLAKIWPVMDKCAVVAKKEILYLQPFAGAAWLWGTIFIDRNRKEDAQAALNKTSEAIKRRKARVLLFPEGTRNSKEKLLPFKKGAFHLAVASKCPIQPVVVKRYNFIGKCKFDDGHIRIKILPPISTDGYTFNSIQNLMDETYNIMQYNIDLLSNVCEEKRS